MRAVSARASPQSAGRKSGLQFEEICLDRSFRLKYDESHELRVEQIGPHEWHGSVYETRPIQVNIVDEATGNVLRNEVHEFYSWERFACQDQACAKKCAIVTVKNRLGVHPDASPLQVPWTDTSAQSDEEWKKELAGLHFPGYYLGRGGREIPRPLDGRRGAADAPSRTPAR